MTTGRHTMVLAAAVLVAAVLAACASTPVPTPAGAVTGIAVAGPTCPVVSVPPDPACGDRPVRGAIIVAVDASGRELARTVTGGDGRYVLTLPLGRFIVGAQMVDGLFAVSEPVGVEIDARDVARVVDFVYDTGIR